MSRQDLGGALVFAKYVIEQPGCTGFKLEHAEGGWYVRFSGEKRDFTQMIGKDGSEDRIAKAICLCGLELLQTLTESGTQSPEPEAPQLR